MSGSEGGSPAPVEPKPEVKGQTIEIKLKDQSENETFYKIKTTTKLNKVFDSYCERQSIARDSVRFLYDGSRIQDTDTPETLEMENGDMIEAFLQQIGGANDEVKPEMPAKQISIKVVDANGSELTFKIKRRTPMKKLIDAYHAEKGAAADTLRFSMSDGSRVLPTHTPETLKMEDGEVLDVHMEQQGGNWFVTLHRASNCWG